MKITVETTVVAPIEEVWWPAYTSPENIKCWNAASGDWHTTAATVDKAQRISRDAWFFDLMEVGCRPWNASFDSFVKKSKRSDQ